MGTLPLNICRSEKKTVSFCPRKDQGGMEYIKNILFVLAHVTRLDDATLRC